MTADAGATLCPFCDQPISSMGEEELGVFGDVAFHRECPPRLAPQATHIADDPRQWRRDDPEADARRELQWLRDYGGRVLAEREAREADNVPGAPRDCACNARLDDRLCPACTTWPYVCVHDPGIKGKGPLTLRDKLLARAERETANG